MSPADKQDSPIEPNLLVPVVYQDGLEELPFYVKLLYLLSHGKPVPANGFFFQAIGYTFVVNPMFDTKDFYEPETYSEAAPTHVLFEVKLVELGQDQSIKQEVIIGEIMIPAESVIPVFIDITETPWPGKPLGRNLFPFTPSPMADRWNLMLLFMTARYFQTLSPAPPERKILLPSDLSPLH